MLKWKDLLNETRDRKSTSERDYRSEFQRDYDRAIFSTPVRRLQDKAQVFPLEAHDFIRSRLTHSLEVSTLARDMGLEAARRIQSKARFSDPQVLHFSTIAATGGLLHDIGNPPFGHAGEIAVRNWFRKLYESDPALLKSIGGAKSQHALDLISFDGNAQTLRLVTQLQVLADYFGLNLTYGTLSALVKYVSSSRETSSKQHDRSKVGYFASEEDVVKRVQHATGALGTRNPIAFVIEAADDLVNATVDVEDAIKKGVVSWTVVREALIASRSRMAKAAVEHADKIVRNSSTSGRDRDEASVAIFRTHAIGEMATHALSTFVKNYDRIMRAEYHNELLRDSDAVELAGVCKDVAAQHAYRSTNVLRLEVMGERVIYDLMDLFWRGARDGVPDCDTREFPCKIYSVISSNYRRVCEKTKHENFLPENYVRLQLVTDYIAGMTDAFAVSLHRQLSNG